MKAGKTKEKGGFMKNKNSESIQHKNPTRYCSLWGIKVKIKQIDTNEYEITVGNYTHKFLSMDMRSAKVHAENYIWMNMKTIKNANMKLLRKFKEPDAQWEEIDYEIGIQRLSEAYRDIEIVKQDLENGIKLQTPFAYYKKYTENFNKGE